jgi:AraC family L-rhamnose operon transcriptional activator RhaR/AraC family L-rhamnose operon regulatory protein RhaS
MSRRKRRIIGRAAYEDGGVQECTGTYRGDFPNPAFRFHLIRVRHDRPFPMHGHPYSELVVVLGGRSMHRTLSEDFPIGEGDVFVINPPMHHGFPDPERLRLCNLQFDPRWAFDGERDLGRMMGFHALFELEPRWSLTGRFRPRLRLTRTQLGRVRSLLDDLETELRGSDEGCATAVRSRFLLLVTELCRWYAQERRRRPTTAARLASAVAYARRHLAEPLRVGELAAVARLSPSQFQRLFRRAYDTTPARKINSLRIEEARGHLEDPWVGIAEVARRTGFASASFFSTQFKRHTGMTPREYRKMARRP